MKIAFQHQGKSHTVNFSDPIDISIPLQSGINNPNAWYIKPPIIEPETTEHWIGAVTHGASVNFNHISFNPHAHGTHTECLGHITEEFISINDCLQTFFFIAEVISILPIEVNGDFQITKNLLQNFEKQLVGKQAVIIRTLPNLLSKKDKQYNHTNWAYLTQEAALYLQGLEIEHLLIDTPSIDKEKDDGQLVAHKAFWAYPKNIRLQATITEFIFVCNSIMDGSYLLNLQIASFVNDASPSKPVLYKIT